MPHIDRLPDGLEDVDALIKRREAAAKKKELWRSLYQDCQRYAMPARESFTWTVEGQPRNNILYDSTLQEATTTAANTTCALLFPPWEHWAELAPGGLIPQDSPQYADIVAGMQDATRKFFMFLNLSNFSQVINETALDLMIGTGALDFDEGESNDAPFKFTSIALSAIEIEEGPTGQIETTFMVRKPSARNLERLYEGLTVFDMPTELRTIVVMKPDQEVDIIQGEIYNPKDKHYYGVAIYKQGKQILWRYDYGDSCPRIVGRATKSSGETYGRGRVMLALSDAKTLDKMQEFVLRHSALAIAGTFTGVSDGVMNPYTAQIAPNTIIPVASNDKNNPSLAVLETGGNFQISEAMIDKLTAKVRRTLLGPEPSEGPVKSATEIATTDRNRLWSMNGEFGRIQAELLTKIVTRGVWIMQKRGIVPKFKINGVEVLVKYTSPFSKSQGASDILALQQTLEVTTLLGPEGAQAVAMDLKIEDIPSWVGRKAGLEEVLFRSDDEKKRIKDAAGEAIQNQTQPPPQPSPGAPAQGQEQPQGM